MPVETTTSNALISCDGSSYDWSDQAEECPTNFAIMAYTSTNSNSEVSTDSNCSSSCLENVKILKEQNEQLLKDLRTSKLNAIAYKIGLESVEARLLVYKKNESVYEEDIKVLKREIHLREVAITELRRKLELAQKQKDEIQLTVENFENSSKNLSKLIDCQIVDKCKTGLGYNVVPPPYTGNFMPPKLDLSFSGLEEFMNEPIVSEPTVKKPVVETSEAKASADKPKVVRKNNGAPIIEEWVSDSEDEAESKPKIEKKTVKPNGIVFKNKEMNQFCERKGDEGFFVGYSINSKAFRVFNSRTRIVEENLHVQFSENTPNIAGSGPNWLFDIDALTKSMNYKLVVAGNQSNGNTGTKAYDDAGKMETVPGKDYILLPLWPADLVFSQSSKSSLDDEFKPLGDDEKKATEELGKEGGDVTPRLGGNTRRNIMDIITTQWCLQ
ncbi:hypothetical protein Tco_0133938 [Tanacetum coccineum]